MQTDKQTDKQTDRQTESEWVKQALMVQLQVLLNIIISCWDCWLAALTAGIANDGLGWKKEKELEKKRERERDASTVFCFVAPLSGWAFLNFGLHKMQCSLSLSLFLPSNWSGSLFWLLAFGCCCCCCSDHFRPFWPVFSCATEHLNNSSSSSRWWWWWWSYSAKNCVLCSSAVFNLFVAERCC